MFLMYTLISHMHLKVVLDLDETLICSYETSSLPDTLKTQATQAGLNWFELECVCANKVCYLITCIWFLSLYFDKILNLHTFECCVFKEADGKPKINYVTVFERPGLKEFLKQLSEFADLVLFTAGLEGLIQNTMLYLCFMETLCYIFAS